MNRNALPYATEKRHMAKRDYTEEEIAYAAEDQRYPVFVGTRVHSELMGDNKVYVAIYENKMPFSHVIKYMWFKNDSSSPYAVVDLSEARERTRRLVGKDFLVVQGAWEGTLGLFILGKFYTLEEAFACYSIIASTS